MTPEERVLEAYYERLTVFPVDKSRVISIEFQSADPELAAQRRQRGRRQLSRAAAERAAGADARRGPLARRRDRRAAQARRRGRSQGRGIPRQDQPVHRHQQHHAVEPDARRIESRSRRRALAEGRARVEGALHPRPAQARRPGRILRRDQFRADPPAQRAARDVARAACRAVVDAARQPSAHQGAEGADRRSRPPDPRRGGSGLRARSRTTRASPARASNRCQAASTSSSSRRPRPTSRTCELRALEREAKAQRDLLESYLAKYREATARDSLGAAPADARIISRALVSNTPYFPKKLPIVLIATLGDAVHLGGLHHHGRASRGQRLPRRNACRAAG